MLRPLRETAKAGVLLKKNFGRKLTVFSLLYIIAYEACAGKNVFPVRPEIREEQKTKN